MGLLEVSSEVQVRKSSEWHMPAVAHAEPPPPQEPSALFWPALILLLACPLATYVPRSRSSINQGLASLEATDVQVSTDPATMRRQIWAFRMASPADGGALLARKLGCTLDEHQKIPDFSKYPNPLRTPAGEKGGEPVEGK